MYHPWRSARYDRPHHKAEHSKITCYDTAYRERKASQSLLYPKGQEMALKSLVTVLNNLAVHLLERR